MKRPAGALILFLAAAGAFFPSCAGTNKAAVRQAGAESEQLLRDAQYQKAVEVYRAALREHPGDKAIAADYVRTIDRVHDAAGIAMKNGDFAAAERIYLLLLKNSPEYEKLSSAPAFTRASLESELKASRIAGARKQARRNLEIGEFGTAIRACRGVLESYPKDPGLAADYVRSIENVRSSGEGAFTKRDYAPAGRAFYALKASVPLFPGTEKKISLDPRALDERLAVCRTALTRQGLEYYRKGELKAAIAVWQSLLVFDPDNAQIKKSIESASAQLKKIQ
jgi:tetratricopeptide (TPR) repeat protein